jgi:dihydrofolate reductase
MRDFINSTYITLDGAVENPHLWPSLGRPVDERADPIQTELLLACDAVLMGRRTYESFAAVWPERSDAAADRINAMPKYVVSTTLRDPAWNNTQVVDGDVAAELRQIKEQPGAPILQYGIGPVSRLLMTEGMLDELRLWVHPLVLGSDERPFAGVPTAGFELVDTTTLSNGIAILRLRRAG